MPTIDRQTIEFLRSRLPSMPDGNRRFCGSVLAYYDRNGFVTAKQGDALMKVYERMTAPTPKAVETINLANIAALIQRAANYDERGNKVTRIKITISLDAATTLVLRYSRNTGRTYVNDKERRNPSDESKALAYGVIEKSGEFKVWQAAGDRAPAIVARLREFDADPHKAGALEGHATGNCCFCGRHLETGESVHAGYGPICAERFGLPWGEGTNSANVFNHVIKHIDPVQVDPDSLPISRELLLKANLIGDEPIGILSRNTLLKLLS